MASNNYSQPNLKSAIKLDLKLCSNIFFTYGKVFSVLFVYYFAFIVCVFHFCVCYGAISGSFCFI